MNEFDVLIVGAGAAGLMCAAQAAKRGQRTLLVEHNKAPGEKIRISGGGRCNFTNLDCAPSAYLSQNPKFAISALARFSQWDFLDLIGRHNISWHEKELGQLFCDNSAKDIIAMLLHEIAVPNVDLKLGASVRDIQAVAGGFQTSVNGQRIMTRSLVIATGGKSIPKMGASAFGHDLARSFGLKVEPTRAGLVPLTFGAKLLDDLKKLAGLSVNAAITCNGARFEGGLLFTHRGLSGPSVLQISSYWREGDEIALDLMPGRDAFDFLKGHQKGKGGQHPATVLAELLPKRLAALVCAQVPSGRSLANLSDPDLGKLARGLNDWRLMPSGSEGYRTAEVTIGGVSTDALDSKTMEARTVPGLYFIGEVVDVTGWLGGYNFQWAWSSGWAAGQVV